MEMLIAMLFVVCLPLFLLPGLIAFLNRKRSRWGLVALNFTLPPAAGAIIQPALGMWFAVMAGLATWLVILHHSLRKDAPQLSDIDEDVELAPYDSSWPEAFARERARIVATFGLPESAIEHIGSTAVPGLAAKPVIDMMLGVAALPPSHDLLSRLTILGYQNLGEAGVPERWYLRLRDAKAFNLNIVVRDGMHWTNNLALRELLRRDPEARQRYAQGKQAALEAGGKRLLAYSEAKRPLMTELLTAARAR